MAKSGKGRDVRSRDSRWPPGRPAAAPSPAWPVSPAAIREVIESVVIAFVLAFVFRAFEAEAFVIPTGSMAPTLMGRHKDVVCDRCGYPFQANASEEVDRQGRRLENVHIFGATCPMCRWTMSFAPREGHPADESYKGDRIIVAKFPYQFHDPARWDVVVFKFPGGAATNYIKRLVGLPDETVKICHGDIFVKPKGAEAFSIERKPPDKVLAVMRDVYDNDYALAEFIQAGWPPRWSPEGTAAADWKSDDAKTFAIEAGGGPEARAHWLVYRHLVPTFSDWQAFCAKRPLDVPRDEQGHPRGQLITDFVAYNSEVCPKPKEPPLPRFDPCAGYPPMSPRLGLNWVGDLVLRCTLVPQSDSGEFLLELVKAGRRYQCRLDVGRGTAALAILDGDRAAADFRPRAAVQLRRGKKHEITFANVDRRLLLWIDGRLQAFDASTEYDSNGRQGDEDDRPTADDLAPARLGAVGLSAEVSRLKLFRDLYYIAVKAGAGQHDSILDYDSAEFCDWLALRRAPNLPLPAVLGGSPDADRTLLAELATETHPDRRLRTLFSNPALWDFMSDRRSVEFPLEKDQYLMLGDNSEASQDSRLWMTAGAEHYSVTRDLLIGKALFIYWPHSWDRLPGTRVPFPFFPNFARMRFVR